MSKRRLHRWSTLLVATALLAVAAVSVGLFAPTPAAAQRRPAPACADRCRQHAQEVLRRCEAAGGEHCAARARTAYDDCVAKCSTGGTPPGCENRCRQRAQELLRRCEAAGGENCAARARTAYNNCVAQCSTGGTPPTCEDRCQKHAQEILRRCEAAGGENCEARAREAYSRCITRCEPAPAAQF